MSLLDLKKLYEYDASGGALRVMNAKPWSMADLWSRFSREAGQPDKFGDKDSEGRGASDSDDRESEGEPSREAKPNDPSSNPLGGSSAASGSGASVLPPESIRQVQPTPRTTTAPPISFRENAELVPLQSLFEGSWGMSFTTEPLLDYDDVAAVADLLLDDATDRINRLMFRHGVQRDVGDPKTMEVWEVTTEGGRHFFVVAWEADGDVHGDASDVEVTPSDIWKQMES